MKTQSFKPKIQKIFGDFGWEGEAAEEELFYMQQAFLAQQSDRRVVQTLADKYGISPDIVISTLLLIHDDPGICGLHSFPYSLLSAQAYPEVVADLAKASQSYAINMLYRAFRPEHGQGASLDSLAHILDSRSDILHRPEIWGLGRGRAGVREPDDPLVGQLVHEHDINILDIPALKSFFLSHFLSKPMPIPGSEPPSSPEGLASAPRGFRHMLGCMKTPFKAAEPYHLPLFLSPFLEALPSDLNRHTSVALEANQRMLGVLMSRLLADSKAKDNFMAMVANVYSQDRSKLVFDPEANCTDGFCYNLAVLLLRVSEGMFGPRFVSKVGTNKFPTFSFFYTARLLDISVGRMFREIQESEDKPRYSTMIAMCSRYIGKYLDFVLDVLQAARARVFKCLAEAGDDSAAGLGDRVARMNTSPGHAQSDVAGDSAAGRASDRPGHTSAAGSAEHAVMHILDSTVSLINFLPEFKLAKTLEDIPYDSAWINAVLTAQLMIKLLRRDREDRNLTSLLSTLFIYKNGHKNLALRIIDAGVSHDSMLIRRIVRYYTDTNDDFIHQERFFINRILENEEIAVDYNSLRMSNAIVSDMESGMSNTLKSILNIKAYAHKGEELRRKVDSASAGDTRSQEELSEDEEAAPAPSESMRHLASMADEELADHLRSFLRKSRRSQEELPQMLKEMKDALLYFRDPYMYKLRSKISVNKRRLEHEERYLRSTISLLRNILHALLSFSLRNRQLFLNKNIFSRLCTVINGSIRDLVGRGSGAFKIENQEKYDYDPRDLLRCLVQLLINILGLNRHLIKFASIDPQLLSRAHDICGSKFLLSELQLGKLKKILTVLEEEETSETQREVPEHLIDPLTCVVMKHPVKLVTSNVIIDVSTFKQIMLNDQTDPFNRMPLTESSCVPVPELEEEIRRFEDGQG